MIAFSTYELSGDTMHRMVPVARNTAASIYDVLNVVARKTTVTAVLAASISGWASATSLKESTLIIFSPARNLMMTNAIHLGKERLHGADGAKKVSADHVCCDRSSSSSRRVVVVVVIVVVAVVFGNRKSVSLRLQCA